jgi:hypothetical protein
MSELGRLMGEVPDFRHLTAQERDEAVERFMVEAARIRAAQGYPWALRIERHEDGFMRPREAWGVGAWQHEPDLVEWRHESGLALLMNRSSTGAWCGYVGLPPPHRYYGRPYGEVEENASHGGLTFADHCHGRHQPRDGESREVWWVGFDCAHAFDLAPAMEALTRSIMPEFERYRPEWSRDVYRDLGYVRETVEALADELAAGAAPGSLGRERWWWWHVGLAKQLFLQDLPEMWRSIYLEQDRLGRYFWREGT